MTLSIETIEIVWVAMLTPGALASAYILRDSIKDRRALRTRGINGAATIAAGASIRAEVIRLFEQIILVGIGVASWFQPPAPPHPVTLYERLFVLAFFAFGFGLAANSILGAITRRKLMHYLTKHITDENTEDTH